MRFRYYKYIDIFFLLSFHPNNTTNVMMVEQWQPDYLVSVGLTFTHLCTTFVDTDEEYAEEQQVDHAPNAKKENQKQKYYCVLIQGTT